MNVVVNCRFLTRPTTGVERFAEQITEQLIGLRDDLVLMAPSRGELRRTELAGLPVQRVGGFSGHAWEQISLRRFLRRQGGPLLVDLANTGPVGYRRQVVAVHDITHRRHPEGYAWRFRALYAAMTPRLVGDSAAVVTVSDFSRRELETLASPRRQITVVPNAVGSWVVRDDALAPRPRIEDPFFLVVGSANSHKNLITAYRAFRDYRDHGGEAVLVVVGSTHRSFSSSTVTGQEGVITLGRVEDAELAWLYGHATAFIFPSLYEGFGIPPLEAQAAGTPVIASDIAALRESLTAESALWFPPTDAHALADALRRVCTDEALRSRLITEGSRNVARFSWRRSAEILSAVLDDVLASGS